jgi:orotate phosphoribosyltransferase-like protein
MVKHELQQLDLETDWPQMAHLMTALYARHGLQDTCSFAEKLELSRRTVQYLISIATRFRALSVDMPADISWRKIAEIVPGLNKTNIETRIHFARRHRRREVIGAIKNKEI